MKHNMNLNNRPFKSIKEGTKTIELRLNDEKRSPVSYTHLTLPTTYTV